MSSRLSASALRAEYLYRIMAFYASGMSGYKGHGLAVNREGGIGRNNPDLQRLIKDGRVLIKRVNTRKVLTPGAARLGFRVIPVYITRAVLTSDVPSIVDITCPSCGCPFASKHPISGIWWRHYNRDDHSYDCELRTDHSHDSWGSRKNEIQQAKRGRKARHRR